MKFTDQNRMRSSREDGQVLTMFALFLIVLFLFVGLGIDLGFAYVTKAQLSKAVDAACLAGISNWNLPSPQPHDIAVSTFYANYPTNSGGRSASPVTVNASFSTDANNNRQITVSATALIKTYFIRVFPQWQTMTVSDSGQATRAKAILTLVLDRSGSMDPNPQSSGGCGTTQGGQYLPTAVGNFINDFDDSGDKAALVSFASTAITNVAMEQPFKNDIKTAANNLIWKGGTFALGGLTNALQIENGQVIATNVSAIKAVVFFTDGQVNMIQSTLSCAGTGTWNIGGGQSDQNTIWFWSPGAPYTATGQNCSQSSTTGNGYSCGGTSCDPATACGSGTPSFPSINGGTLTLTTTHVVAESEARCIAVATQMRRAGIFVYAIGLSDGTIDAPSQTFLQQVANDQKSPTYDRTLPQGVALVTGNGSNLSQLFQQIADDILLRLTQ